MPINQHQQFFLLKPFIMKLLLMTIVVLSSYIAKGNSIPVHISPQAIIEFKKTFKDAVNIEWSQLGDLSRVRFNYNNETVYAFYNEEGERISMGRTISIRQLPLPLQIQFQNRFTDYTVLEVFEIYNDNGMSFYISVKSSNKKIILKSLGMNWVVFSKTRIK